MAMRETVRSLRIYLVLAGVVSSLRNAGGLLKSESALETAISLVGVVISIAFVYVGFRLAWLLPMAPQQVLTVLLASAAYLVGLGVLAVMTGTVSAILPTVAIGLLITWYLYVNAKRLAAESAVKPVSS